MQFKNLSLIAGAIALSLTATPLYVKAETTSNAPLRLAQAQQQAPQQAPLRLQLSEQQQTRIAKIRNDTRTKVEQLLTQKQRDQLQAALKAGTPARQAFASIQFTPQQQSQLQQIIQSSQQQMEAVLTPDQKRQIQQYQEQLRLQQTSPSSAPKKP